MHKKYIYPLTSTAYGGDEGELYQRNDGSADNTLLLRRVSIIWPTIPQERSLSRCFNYGRSNVRGEATKHKSIALARPLTS